MLIQGLKKGPFTAEEDALLKQRVDEWGEVVAIIRGLTCFRVRLMKQGVARSRRPIGERHGERSPDVERHGERDQSTPTQRARTV